jgi:FlaA1/EpsC-like NDP-sugar epimerase
MIELSGLEVRDERNPHGEIEIIEIGLRPGEKLYEELLISGEPNSTSHPRIFKAREEFLVWNQMSEQITRLEIILSTNDRDALALFLSEIVPGYHASEAE